MLTIILCVEYDGTDYFGWQSQPNKKTIQDELNYAIRKALGFDYVVNGAGRTDAGVHSTGQIAHFICEEEPMLSKIHGIPRHKVKLAINQKLSKNIRVKRLWFSELEFHSRFDAVMREYRYRFSRRPSVFNQRFTTFFPYKMDLELLFNSAEIFLGKNNFYTFSKTNSTNSDYCCEIIKCQWQQIADSSFELTVIADRFVYGMVRAMVGAMIDIARTKRTVDEISFALKNQNRELASPLAPSTGLNLHRIYYEKPFEIIV